MANKNKNYDDEIIDPNEMYLTLELDGEEKEFKIILIFEVDHQDYIAITPEETYDDSKEDLDFYLMRYYESEDGEPSADYITDDAEFDRVAKYFEENCF